MAKKKKSSKNASNTSSEITSKRALIFKVDMEEYGKVTKVLGNKRLMITLPDGTEIMGIIPGRFRKNCWIGLGDVVLVSRRDFQESKVDVVHKYEKDEPHRLLTVGEIPLFFVDGTSASENNINDSSLLIIGEDETEQTDDKIDFDDI